MELAKILLILFGVLFTFCECVQEDAVARLCPVRAVPVHAEEANADAKVQCVCMHQFYGKNCRYRGKLLVWFTALFINAIDIFI